MIMWLLSSSSFIWYIYWLIIFNKPRISRVKPICSWLMLFLIRGWYLIGGLCTCVQQGAQPVVWIVSPHWTQVHKPYYCTLFYIFWEFFFLKFFFITWYVCAKKERATKSSLLLVACTGSKVSAGHKYSQPEPEPSGGGGLCALPYFLYFHPTDTCWSLTM